MADVSFFWAFAAGFVSFLGPCVLPLIPGYLSFISGLSIEELGAADSADSGRVVAASAAFVLGFSLVFVLMGASASLIGGWLLTYKSVLLKGAAILIIVFGLSLIGLFKLPFFQTGHLKGNFKSRGPWAVLLLGMAFAVAWTPCVGPILAAILAYAGSTGTVATGMALLAFYSLGLGLPFILSGLLFTRFLAAFSWIRRHYQAVSVISGLLLVAMGVLMLTNHIVLINAWLRKLQLTGGWGWTNL